MTRTANQRTDGPTSPNARLLAAAPDLLAALKAIKLMCGEDDAHIHAAACAAIALAEEEQA